MSKVKKYAMISAVAVPVTLLTVAFASTFASPAKPPAGDIRQGNAPTNETRGATNDNKTPPATTNLQQQAQRAMVPMYPTTVERDSAKKFVFEATPETGHAAINTPGSGKGIRIGRDKNGELALIVPEEVMRYLNPQDQLSLFDAALKHGAGGQVNDGINWTANNKKEFILTLKALRNRSDFDFINYTTTWALAAEPGAKTGDHNTVVHINSTSGPRAGQADWMTTKRPDTPAVVKNGKVVKAAQPQPDYTLGDLALVSTNALPPVPTR